MYTPKPRVKNPEYKRVAEDRRQEKEENSKRLANQKKLEKRRETEKHKAVIAAIEKNSTNVKDVIDALKEQIQQIDFEVPEFDGTLIVDAIEKSTQDLNESLSGLNKQIQDIKIEIPEVDMVPHTRAITQTMDQNTANLKKVLESVRQQISSIRLETNEPITDWRFHIRRDDKRDIEYIDAKANLERTLN